MPPGSLSGKSVEPDRHEQAVSVSPALSDLNISLNSAAWARLCDSIAGLMIKAAWPPGPMRGTGGF
jgi:hypothetical protein